jgi:hypothetical protein
MEQEQMKQKAEQAAAIAKEIAEALKAFDKETALLMYAKQMGNRKPNTAFPEDAGHRKMDNEEATERLDKTLAAARLKWKYASESDKEKVAQMERIVAEGQERIKQLYK